MDKYEFNIKIEQIKKLVDKGDYETAMKIADTIDWRRVRSTTLLTMVSQVYESNEEYQDAKDILLLAYERAPIGKGLLFKLTDLALREGNVSEAEAYYREFCDLSGDDPRQFLLRYLILEASQAPLEQLVHSLERYCQEELDEKWLYRLAELYQEEGREQDCVAICDKIMLMFGLGKYVDKAMELKIQYAPLTSYQMDLVENREKYEKKLQAVEEEFNNRKFVPGEEEYYDSDDDQEMEEIERENMRLEEMSPMDMGPAEMRPEDDELAVHLREAETEEDLAREMSKLEPYDEEPEDSAGGETRILGNIRDIKAYRAADYAAATREPLPAAAQDRAEAEEGMEQPGQPESGQREEDEEPLFEDWDLEDEDEEQNHLMIEAEDAAVGLELALESLKKIHKETGTKSPVAKISGENLNRKGIPAVAERLRGKDLIVEKAADLDQGTIEDLCALMDQDDSGMIVALIDTPSRMERLHRGYPVLASKFQYIGCGSGRPVKSGKSGQTLAEREEEIRQQAVRDAEEARRRKEEQEERVRQIEQEKEERERLARYKEEEERRRAQAEEEARRQAEYEAENAVRLQVEREAEDARRLAEYEAQRGAGDAGGYEGDALSGYGAGYEEEALPGYGAGYEGEKLSGYADGPEEGPIGYDAGYRDIQPRRGDFGLEEPSGYPVDEEEAPGQDPSDGEAPRRSAGYEERRKDAEVQQRYESDGGEASEDAWPEEEAGDGHGMDVEEFAQYACKYAGEIDCSISGKSMLALYERAEMMEEDGIPLTKDSAEELIEEAADKAEKRSFGGLFSSKYDKDGLLILKEKHFFD